jgi:hypothetical protein
MSAEPSANHMTRRMAEQDNASTASSSRLTDGGTKQLDNLRVAHLSCNCSRAAQRTNAMRRGRIYY